MKVLDCGPEDLIHVEREGEGDAAPRPASRPVRPAGNSHGKRNAGKEKRERRDAGDASSLTGPKAIPFPVSLGKDKD